MKEFVLIFFSIMTFAGLVMVISILLLRLTLTRRIKKKQREIGGYYWDAGTLDFGFLNTIAFTWVCAIPAMRKLGNAKIYVGENLDVRAFANRFEVALSYACIGSLGIIILAIIIYYPTDYFGLIDWDAANSP